MRTKSEGFQSAASGEPGGLSEARLRGRRALPAPQRSREQATSVEGVGPRANRKVRPALQVVPAIIAQSKREFQEKLACIEYEAPLVHLDVMDGKFVPNTTWADPLEVARMRTPTQFEVHLMVEEPFREVILWGKLKNVRRIIVHAESTKKLRELLHTIRATGKRVGLAVNPPTPLRTILPLLEGVDAALVLANQPGQYGRPLRPETLRRIRAIRRRFPRLPIGVDIGVNMKTAPRIRVAGATFAIAGSSVFKQPNPVAAYRALVRAFTKQFHPSRARTK